MNDIVMILRRFKYGEKETLGWLYVMDNKTTLGVFSTLEKPKCCFFFESSGTVLSDSGFTSSLQFL